MRSSSLARLVRPDLHARVVAQLIRWGAGSGRWRVETLAFLADTEARSVEILAAARRAVSDRRLRQLLDRHICDEARHAGLFEARCDALAKELGIARPRPRAVANDARSGFDILGFFAFLEVTELRGSQTLSTYRQIFADDPDTLAVIASVLADERFHVGYSHIQLERWIREGLADEVAAARRHARRIDRRALRQQVFGFLLSPLRRARMALALRPPRATQA